VPSSLAILAAFDQRSPRASRFPKPLATIVATRRKPAGRSMFRAYTRRRSPTNHLFDLVMTAIISFIAGHGFCAFTSRLRQREGFW
jgi:hypothetical protein